MDSRSLGVVKQPEHHEERELDRQRDEIGDNDRDGCDQAWKVDLTKKVGVGDKGLGCTGKAVGEIVPQYCTR